MGFLFDKICHVTGSKILFISLRSSFINGKYYIKLNDVYNKVFKMRKKIDALAGGL